MFSIIQIAFYKFIGDIITLFLVRFKAAVEEILEKEDPENGKHDEKLDKDDKPKLSAPGHGSETVIIKEENPVENVMLQYIEVKSI